MKHVAILTALVVVTAALCVARMIWAKGTFGVEMFLIPIAFGYSAYLFRREESGNVEGNAPTD